MKHLLILGTIIIFNLASAEIIDRACTPGIIETVNIGKIAFSFDGMRGQCVITYNGITRETAGHDTSRAFKASDLGLFFINSSFYNPNSSKSSGTTGMKGYSLTPVTGLPHAYANSETGEVYLQLASGEKVYFNSQTGMIDTERTTSPKFSEDPAITNKNSSGVKILSRNGVVIDLGYRQGGNPLVLEDKLATITDPQNNKCTIKIKELYDTARFDFETQTLVIDNNLTETKTDRFLPKATGAELVRLITTKSPKCQQLDLSTLNRLPDVENIVSDIERINSITPGVPASASRSPAVINSDREALEINTRHNIDTPTTNPVRDQSRVLDR